MCIYMYIHMHKHLSLSLSLYIYIYIYIYNVTTTTTTTSAAPYYWVFITGGCSGRRVQWIGVVLCNKLVYNIIHSTTPCFHCTPL